MTVKFLWAYICNWYRSWTRIKIYLQTIQQSSNGHIRNCVSVNFLTDCWCPRVVIMFGSIRFYTSKWEHCWVLKYTNRERKNIHTCMYVMKGISCELYYGDPKISFDQALLHVYALICHYNDKYCFELWRNFSHLLWHSFFIFSINDNSAVFRRSGDLRLMQLQMA